MNNIPTNRADAKAQGVRHYFTGKPCKHGHIALRETKGSCVECRKLEHQACYAGRKDYFAEYNRSEKGKDNKRRYYDQNKDLVIAKAQARSEESKRAYRKKYDEENPEYRKARCSARRARFKQATPKWLTAEQKKAIRDKYLEAQHLIRATGKRFEVDHMEPILGEDVCGLHVPWNLQILLKEDNLKKSNKRIDNTH